MTDVLAIRTDGFTKNLDKTRIDNAKTMSTGPWNVNPKRLIETEAWIVLYRNNYPDVIATIRKPWWVETTNIQLHFNYVCLLYTSPSPRDGLLSRMPSSA